MRRHSKFERGKAHSLVFEFKSALHRDEDFNAPEPDFYKWMKKSLFVDVGISHDEAMDKDRPESEQRAWEMYYKALEATGELLQLHETDLPLFQKVASQMSFLPVLISWHPDNECFNHDLRNLSHIGLNRMAGGGQPKPQHLARQSWPTRYAYAIIETIDLTLDTYEDRLPEWAEIYGYGNKHPIPMSHYEETARRMGWDEARMRLELPRYVDNYEILPAWTQSLKVLHRPFNERHVLDYWRTGKEMILEEMPKFHLRPEWESHRRRHYKTGAKAGAVQHAIFKDILAALRTIAGTNYRRKSDKPVTK